MWSPYWLPAIVCFLFISAVVFILRINKWRHKRNERRQNINDEWLDTYRDLPIRNTTPPIIHRQLKEAPKINLVANENAMCPLCRDELAESSITACDGCSTSFHIECLTEMGGKCSTLGCRKRIKIST